MKKLIIFLCAGLFTTPTAHAEESVNHNFRKFEIPANKITTGRSLQEIFAQHGTTSRSGDFIVTADGILENDTPPAKALAALQHRATLLKLAKEANLFKEVDNKNKSDNARLLVQYIQHAYGNERSPLFSFVADLVREHNEITLINTEALRLISETPCKKGAQELLQNMCQYKGVLLFFDSLLEKLWEEIIYLFSLESYAAQAN